MASLVVRPIGTGVTDYYARFDDGKSYKIKAVFKQSNTNGDFSFGFAWSSFGGGGTGNDPQIRFYWDGTDLTARVGKGDASGNLTSTTISGITVTDMQEYIIEWDGANEAKFYIDGTLKATITTNLPASQTDALYIHIGCSAGNTIITTPLVITKEL